MVEHKKTQSQTEIAMEAARERQNSLTKPAGSLGRLEDLAIWLAGVFQTPRPQINQPACIVFAGNHGITAQGVSAFPAEVTQQMVENFNHGGAAINQLCALGEIKLNVVPLELETPTADFSNEAAMTVEAFEKAIQIGKSHCDSLVKDGVDCLLLGEMGIGNTTAAAAIAHALFGGKAKDWVGVGTGIDASQLAHKTALVEKAVQHHTPAFENQDGFEILRQLGGRELAAIAGAVIQARNHHIPVILDGFVATAAAAPLIRGDQTALDHCVIAHLSAESGHKNLAESLRKSPILDLDMRLGEASGAAIALYILKAALATHNGMASFAEAGVSEKT